MATITKKLGFENLLSNPSMNKDSDGDGVVDGWSRITSPAVTQEFLYDPTEQAQMINVLSATGQGFPTVYQTVTGITAGKSYVLSAYMKGEGNLSAGSSGTGPRLQIKWLDASNNSIGDVFQNPVTPTDFTRYQITGTAPTGAAMAEIRLVFRCNDSSAQGTVWFKNVQFQEGSTATDYEENDFFVVTTPADGYDYGWERTQNGKNSGVFGFGVKDYDQMDWDFAGAYIDIDIPENAENPTLSIWVDPTTMGEEGTVYLFLGDWGGTQLLELYKDDPAGVYTFPMPRGFSRLLLDYWAGGIEDPGSPYVDDIVVSWEEADPNPAPEPPQTKKVHTLDFESEEHDPFFKVYKKAPGYSYGFARSYRYRNSGFYSMGVEDVYFDPGPPTIPNNATAAFQVEFTVPETAINPALRLFAFYDAEYFYDLGEIRLNGEVIATLGGEFEPIPQWHEIIVPLAPGKHTLLVLYTKNSGQFKGTDSIYIDDITVYYDIPKKPFMYVATQPKTEIKTTSTNFSVLETFESSSINKFFTVNNPAKLKSGGGPSQYPEAGWIRSSNIAYQGSYSYRAQREKLKHGEDAAIDFVFKVPYGVKNAKVEFWNFVELERSLRALSGEKYPRLYEEYRIWVNYTLWKEFNHASPSLTNSVKYSTGNDGDPANDYACPWGRWWKESLPLTPGQTYILTFELQRDSKDSSTNVFGRNLCAVDNLQVTWQETPGDVVTISPEPLVYLDGREGYKRTTGRGGAEIPPISFNEYKVYGQPGSVYQATNIEPRVMDVPIRITARNRNELSERIRNLTSKLANRPLSLITVYPEGEKRILNCHLMEDMWREDRETFGSTWRNIVLSFRAFDPFWYGERVIVDGSTENLGNPTWVKVNNTGDAPVWPIIKLYGPVTNPQVQLTDPSDDTIIHAEFKLTGFTIPSGRYVVVDTRPGRKTIILDDGQDLYQYLDPSINELFNIPQGEWGVDLDGSSIDSNTKVIVEYQLSFWGDKV